MRETQHIDSDIMEAGDKEKNVYFEDMQKAVLAVKNAVDEKEKETAKLHLLNVSERMIKNYCQSFFYNYRELFIRTAVHAQDLEQVARLHLYNICDKYDPNFVSSKKGEHASFYYWFFKISLWKKLRNKFIVYYREQMRNPGREAYSLDEHVSEVKGGGTKQENISSGGEDPEKAIISAELKNRIGDHLRGIDGADGNGKYHPLQSLLVILHFGLGNGKIFQSWQERFKALTIEQLKITEGKYYDIIMRFVRGEKRVIDDKELTLEELGEIFGVTREYIRQTLKRTLGILRKKVDNDDRF